MLMTIFSIMFKGVRKVGVKSPLEIDLLQEMYYLRNGDKLFSHTFFLLICGLNSIKSIFRSRRRTTSHYASA